VFFRAVKLRLSLLFTIKELNIVSIFLLVLKNAQKALINKIQVGKLGNSSTTTWLNSFSHTCNYWCERAGALGQLAAGVLGILDKVACAGQVRVRRAPGHTTSRAVTYINMWGLCVQIMTCFLNLLKYSDKNETPVHLNRPKFRSIFSEW